MQAVKSTNTAPELKIRHLVHCMGYRFRLHRKDLPGKPDLVFAGIRKVVFVHGCFWHGHNCARGARVPKRNRAYWSKKITRNRERDRTSCVALKDLGWKTAVFWECELKDEKYISHRLRRFLG